jgi:hypothetical protein
MLRAALVHEVYLRLSSVTDAELESKAQVAALRIVSKRFTGRKLAVARIWHAGRTAVPGRCETA